MVASKASTPRVCAGRDLACSIGKVRHARNADENGRPSWQFRQRAGGRCDKEQGNAAPQASGAEQDAYHEK
jgi:hypothetical protein